MQDTILKKIIYDKKTWIHLRKKQQPLKNIEKYITQNTRNFQQALTKDKPAFILECKKASPSLGVIKKDFNLINISNIYKKYAAAISVVTDEKYFHGNLEFINIVRKNTKIPILCKDFFLEPYQVYLARYYRADAILLMLSVLNDEQYQELSIIAQQLNMSVLTEINNTMELERALYLKANIIGINNRNLHDLSVNLQRTIKLSSLIKKDIIIISESGIKKYRQIRKLKKYVHGFLIGSYLMSEKNLEIGVRKIIFGKNKICGLTSIKDLKNTEKYGAVYAGMIFVKSSLRNITFAYAKKIILHNILRYVGVFQNENINIIAEIAETLSLYAVQLHGNEDQKYINQLRIVLPKNIKIWKAFSINVHFPSLNYNHINTYILDSIYGGSNKCFDWSILKNKYLDNVILAGGINSKNCYIASHLNCAGLDLNSGVEISPGIKDDKKIKLIFQKLRYY